MPRTRTIDPRAGEYLGAGGEVTGTEIRPQDIDLPATTSITVRWSEQSKSA